LSNEIMKQDDEIIVYSEVEGRRRRGAWIIITLLFSPLLCAAVIFVLTVILGINTFSGIIDGITSIFRPQQTTAVVTSTQTVVNSVRPLGQFVSISAQLAKADIHISIQDGLANACGFSASHVIQGTVEGGVDLSQLRSEDVSYDTLSQTYTISLPPPQLTSCRIDLIRQYDLSQTVCSVDWDSARALAQYQGLTEFRDDSIEGGLLERAQDEAQTTLTNFLQLATGQRVNITFRAETPALPSSCQPDIPDGWVYDAEDEDWSQP